MESRGRALVKMCAGADRRRRESDFEIYDDLRHKPVEKECVSREADYDTLCNNNKTPLIDAMCFGRCITNNDIDADEEISLKKSAQLQMDEETTKHATQKSGEPVLKESIDVMAFERCITNNVIIDSEIIGPEKPVQPGVFKFHAYTSAPTSVEPNEEIKAPMSAPLPVIQDASPLSLSKFYDSRNTIINLISDMIDVKKLASQIMLNRSVCTDGSKVNWLKIKCLRFEKDLPGIVQIRYDYEGSYLTLDTRSTKRGRQTRSRPSIVETAETISQIRLEKAYKQQLPITKDKKKDLLNLCKKKIIPEELHAWYESLPSTNEVANDSESE